MKNSPWQQQEDFNKRQGYKRYEILILISKITKLWKKLFTKEEKD